MSNIDGKKLWDLLEKPDPAMSKKIKDILEEYPKDRVKRILKGDELL